MTFEEILDQAIAMLQRRGRVSYRTLTLQFHLNEESLAALKEELLEVHHLAVDYDGRMLVWAGEGRTTSVAPTPQPPHQALQQEDHPAQVAPLAKPRHDLRYPSVHFSRPYPVRTDSNSTNCCVATDLCPCRRRVRGRYNTKDSWGVSGMSAPCGEAKRVG